MSKQPEINLDAAMSPATAPGLSFGDLIKWAPVLEEVIAAVEQAIAGGALTVPAIRFQVAGKHMVLGPTPIQVS